MRLPFAASLAAVLLLGACSRGPRTTTQRIAILAVDNLTGDASLDWIAAAAPRILVSQLSGPAGTSAVMASSESDSYAAGATELLRGYFDRRSTPLHFEFTIEDVASHKMLDPVALDAAPLQALDSLAHRIDPGARSFSSANSQAVEAFGRGDYQQAVELDPDFSGAWLAWAQSFPPADSAKATEVISRALMHPGLRSAADRSRLELLAASLTHDPEAELRALEGLTSQAQSDPNAARSLAETAMNARDFPKAVKYYQALQKLAPNDASVQNLLGYAFAFSGDLESAMKAFEIYRKQQGQEANALDSMGEAYFINGRFAEAEKFFLQAQDKDPRMLGGGDLLKSAYARYLAGDRQAADQMFSRFSGARAEARDPVLVWKQAIWLYATGRASQAQTALEIALSSASPQLADLIRKQLAAWKSPHPVPTDLPTLKQAYQSTTPSSDGLARTLYAAALAESGDRRKARQLAAAWPLPDSAGDPVLVPFLYPKFLELREKLR